MVDITKELQSIHKLKSFSSEISNTYLRNNAHYKMYRKLRKNIFQLINTPIPCNRTIIPISPSIPTSTLSESKNESKYQEEIKKLNDEKNRYQAEIQNLKNEKEMLNLQHRDQINELKRLHSEEKKIPRREEGKLVVPSDDCQQQLLQLQNEVRVNYVNKKQLAEITRKIREILEKVKKLLSSVSEIIPRERWNQVFEMLRLIGESVTKLASSS